MRDLIFGLSAMGLCALAACASTDKVQGANKAASVLALADAARPQADKDRDAARKPAEMLAFAGIGPGTKVAEFQPGTGYFTRIFAKAVAPNGKVYAAGFPPRGGGPPAVAAIAADPAYDGKVVVLPLGPNATFTPPEKVDVFWTSRNYHDLGLSMGGPPNDLAAFNKSVFDSLKPGGVYIVLDHSAGPNAGPEASEKLHRINPNIVRAQVEAAGFQFVAQNDTLKNPADSHEKPVIDQSIRDHTDQFILKFRKR